MRRPVDRLLAAALALPVLVLLGGCAQQRIREESDTLLREGRYEEAMTQIEEGLKDYPSSATLRAGAIQARNDALTRLLAEATLARSANRLDDAEAALKRAWAFDSGGKRVDALLADLAVERRQRTALNDAEALAAADKPDAALRLLAEALKDNPRQPDLVTLQRRLELDVRQAQVKAAQLGLAEQRPISLDFRDANLRTVLDVVSRNSGVNFVLDKDIAADTRVTIYLRQARVEEAIDLITSTYQLAKKVIDGQTILIYPNTPDKQREFQEQIVKVFYLTNGDAKGAAAFLRSMLKLREPFVDERASMLAIRDSQENVQLAERLIALYDTNEPEVLLEVEVIELRTSRLTELGVRLPDTFSLTLLPPSGSSGLTLGNVRDVTRDRIALGIGGVTVNLRREAGDFSILANPRIRAKNKEKAKVLIGDKVPVVTTTTGTGGFVSDTVTYLDVGLKLDVEPTVYFDDEVAIRIALEVSSLAREIKTASGSLAYQIGTRNASTLLRLRDGETQLLAGLISNEDRTSASRVPGLGDLPVMGRLFSDTRDDAHRTELVLSITPRILRNVKRPSVNETELWVGTEALPRLRQVAGRTGVSLPSPQGGDAPVAKSPAAQSTQPSSQDAASGLPLPARSDAVPRARTQLEMRAGQLQWRAPPEVQVGETFSATLAIAGGAPLRGAPLQFNFSKDRLSVLDIEEGGYFRQGGVATSFTKSIDAPSGVARVGILRNEASAASGEGTLLTVRLKALSAGEAELALTAMEPISPAGTVSRPAFPAVLKVLVK